MIHSISLIASLIIPIGLYFNCFGVMPCFIVQSKQALDCIELILIKSLKYTQTYFSNNSLLKSLFPVCQPTIETFRNVHQKATSRIVVCTVIIATKPSSTQIAPNLIHYSPIHIKLFHVNHAPVQIGLPPI